MIRLDRVQLATIAAITATTGAVGLWARSRYPRRVLGDEVVVARVANGPTFRGLSQYQADEPTAVRWTVSSAAAGDRTGLFFGGRRWHHDATAGQTVQQVRDAVRALISEPGVTVTPVSTNALDITGAIGLLYHPTAIGPSAVAVQAATPCEVVTGTGDLVLELQAFATGSGAEALGLLAAVIVGLEGSPVLADWTRYGVAYRGASQPNDLTAMAGADWESRAAVRLDVSTRAYRAAATDYIDAVDLTATTDAPQASILASAP